MRKLALDFTGTGPLSTQPAPGDNQRPALPTLVCPGASIGTTATVLF